jgi:hypothetical protein
LAVYELLDDLRERIWLAYALDVQTLLEQQRSTGNNVSVPKYPYCVPRRYAA